MQWECSTREGKKVNDTGRKNCWSRKLEKEWHGGGEQGQVHPQYWERGKISVAIGTHGRSLLIAPMFSVTRWNRKQKPGNELRMRMRPRIGWIYEKVGEWGNNQRKCSKLLGSTQSLALVNYPEFTACCCPSVLRAFHLHNPTPHHTFRSTFTTHQRNW